MNNAIIHRLSESDVLRTLAMTCKRLDRLEFLQTGFGGASIQEAVRIAANLKVLKVSRYCKTTLDAVTQILKARPSLAEVEFDAVESSGRIADWDVELPGLRRLRLRGGDIQKFGSTALSLVSYAISVLFSICGKRHLLTERLERVVCTRTKPH